MQRYVKMVVGLLLLVVMLQPLLAIFTEDVDAWLFSILNETNRTEQSVANTINLQKREIELGQRAYISEQVAVQLKSQVEEALQEEYALKIVRVNVELANDTAETVTEQEIKAIYVHVQTAETKADVEKSEEYGDVQPIEVVQINTSQTTPVETLETSKDLESVKQFLSQYWHIPNEMILLAWEGGKRAE